MKVIIDTNAVLIPATLGVDIFEEIDRVMEKTYKLYVLSGTIDELGTIINSKKKYKTAAIVGLKLLSSKNVSVLSSTGHVDDEIVRIAKKEKVTIVTQDKELKKRVKQYHAIILTLRQKKILVKA
jgi:rRNA-processing protein FCF1